MPYHELPADAPLHETAMHGLLDLACHHCARSMQDPAGGEKRWHCQHRQVVKGDFRVVCYIIRDRCARNQVSIAYIVYPEVQSNIYQPTRRTRAAQSVSAAGRAREAHLGHLESPPHLQRSRQ